jgi:tRNA-dihydrouridine synthase A
VAAMSASVSVPVTVKMRVGVVTHERGGTSQAGDSTRPNEPARQGHPAGQSPRQSESAGRGESIKEAVARFDEADFEALHHFVAKVYAAGCRVAIVHARKAVLGGLSPKDNREIPPLRFDVVQRIKKAFPGLPVIVNGGIRNSAGALEALTWCEGVMLGREAYHRPFVLRELHHALYPNEPELLRSREKMLERMACYAQSELARGGRLSAITRHMLGLYGGQPGAREYRRYLSEGAREADAGPELIRRAGRLAASQPEVRAPA